MKKTLREDCTVAVKKYAAKAARRRRRSPQSGFFLVGNGGKKRSVETAMGRREEGAGACLLAWKKETGLLCTGTGEYAYLITRK